MGSIGGEASPWGCPARVSDWERSLALPATVCDRQHRAENGAVSTRPLTCGGVVSRTTVENIPVLASRRSDVLVAIRGRRQAQPVHPEPLRLCSRARRGQSAQVQWPSDTASRRRRKDEDQHAHQVAQFHRRYLLNHRRGDSQDAARQDLPDRRREDAGNRLTHHRSGGNLLDIWRFHFYRYRKGNFSGHAGSRGI